MKKLLLGAFLFLTACSHRDVEPDNQPNPNLRTLSTAEQTVSATNNDFAFSLFKRVQSGHSKNIFISPLSVGLALGMTLNGAEGATKTGILNAIQFDGLVPADVNQAYHDLTGLLISMDRTVEMRLANSVWYKNIYTVKSEFSSIVKDFYDGKAEGLDFTSPSAKDVINGWVEDKTNHRIKNLIESISSDDVMFLINAIYFKGDWTNQFDKFMTKKDEFIREDGSTEQVDMMYSKGVKLSFFANNQLSLLDIPYGNGQFNMTILLPNNTKTVASILQNLGSDSITYWLDRAEPRTPILEMPKFKMEWKNLLNEPLSDMGMSIAFSDNASFPYLFENPLSLKVSKVIHQSFIEVDEVGSEAAAATVVGIATTSIGLPVLDHIKINRPFIFMIREKHSGVILFIGQLHSPGN
jgi:serpin B